MRKKVLINYIEAHSLKQQADLIAKLLEQKGYLPVYSNYITYSDLRKDDVAGGIWILIAAPHFFSEIMASYVMGSGARIVYMTTEGVPSRSMAHAASVKHIDIVGVSEYAARCISQIGMNVVGYVHHAVDADACDLALRTTQAGTNPWKWFIERHFKDKVIFSFVARDDPRKGIDHLKQALELLDKWGLKDFVVALFSERSVETKLKSEHAVWVADFGSQSYTKYLQLLACCDYIVWPSLCEGFGIPLLEANALGKPGLHVWAPPMDEFSSKEYNLTWDYLERIPVTSGFRMQWIFHDYDPFCLAEMMKHAIQIKRESPEEYKEWSEGIKQHSRNWDYRLIYPKLLRYMKLTKRG